MVTEILQARSRLKDGQNLCPEEPPGSLGTLQACGGTRDRRAGCWRCLQAESSVGAATLTQDGEALLTRML